MAQRLNLRYFRLVQIGLEGIEHPQESRFGRVGDVREHRVLQVAVHGAQDVVAQLPPQRLALAVDVAVASAAEIDALEGAGLHRLGSDDLLQPRLAVPPHAQCLSRLQFMDLLGLEGEHRLYDGALGRHHDHFVVPIPEGRTDAPRVAHGEHLAAARQATHHIAAVPQGRGGAQHVVHVDALFDIFRHSRALQSPAYGLGIQAFALAVEPVPHLFQHDVRVGVDARMLPLGRNGSKHFVHVREVEVAAECQVLGPPVVAAQEGMDKRKATLSGSGIPEVAHVHFTSKRQMAAREGGVGQPFRTDVLETRLHGGKDFRDGSRAQRALAKQIFLAGACFHLHAGQTCAFLPAVMLLFHQQI